MAMSDSRHPYYVCDSRSVEKQGFSTLDQALEALLGWVLVQRQAGEAVLVVASRLYGDVGGRQSNR
jgi:hypothetical protein